jgi:hypothetical protein
MHIPTELVQLIDAISILCQEYHLSFDKNKPLVHLYSWDFTNSPEYIMIEGSDFEFKLKNLIIDKTFEFCKKYAKCMIDEKIPTIHLKYNGQYGKIVLHDNEWHFSVGSSPEVFNICSIDDIFSGKLNIFIQMLTK